MFGCDDMSVNGHVVPAGRARAHCGRNWARIAILIIFLCICASEAIAQITAQESPANVKINRERGLDILSQVKDKIRDLYYDPTFHGVDLDLRFNAARERIKGLQANAEIFETIAGVVLELNDSHTMFLPPSRFNHIEYGFSLQMMGEQCYVVDVKHGSDAEAQGLKIGDLVVSVGVVPTTRNTLWRIHYVLYSLEPRPVLTLTVKNDDGSTHALKVRSRVVKADEWKREMEQRAKDEKIAPELKSVPYKCHEISSDLIACKLYNFVDDTDVIDKMMKKSAAGHKKLILDLRGNPGGRVETATRLIGYFFDHPVKLGTEVSRRKSKERIAKNQSGHEFRGDLVVLVDSTSASASEVFARVMQIEKRGKVIGDATSGKVMTGQLFALAAAVRLYTFSVFEIEVTVADLVMSDGQRLEGKGVVPDVPIVPTGRALAEKDDPILAYAANMEGAQLSAEDAGKFYFITRPPEPNAEGNR